MKRKLLILLLVATLVLSAAAFAACGGNNGRLTVEFDDSHYVYEGDTLDSLKPYLTVTYKEWVGVEQLTDFRLSGTLQEGTCPITVYYRDLSATIDITVWKLEEAFGFELNDSGESYAITLLRPLSNRDLVIPFTYNGKPITEIGESAFSNSNSAKLISVTIPDTIIKIGKNAFRNCNNLTSVKLPNGLTEISDGLFSECSRLKNITIPSGVTKIGKFAFSYCFDLETITIPNNVTEIGQSAFQHCSNLKNITIPSKVTEIGVGAFGGCEKVASMVVEEGNTVYHSAQNCIIQTATNTLVSGCKNSVIPTDGSVTAIAEKAFEDCSGLTSVTIPDSVTAIGQDVFYGCSGIASITVSDGNTTYHSNGNCLIETETHTLIAGCKNSVIPADGSVTKIGHGAFADNFEIENITIPDGVTEIGDKAFYFCQYLASIIIPDSVTQIGSNAFSSCTGLDAVYYKGAANDWAQIDFNYDSFLNNAPRYYYSEMPPALNSDGTAYDGNYWHYVGDVPTVWVKE